MLTEKEKLIKEMYERQLRVPKWKYILLYGVLFWGGMLLLIMSLVDRFMYNKSWQQQWDEGLLGRIIVIPLAGVFVGWYMRRLYQRRLNKLKEKE